VKTQRIRKCVNPQDDVNAAPDCCLQMLTKKLLGANGSLITAHSSTANILPALSSQNISTFP